MTSQTKYLAIIFICISSVVLSAGTDLIRGFDQGSSKEQRELEAKFDSLLNTEGPRAWMERMTSKPHHVGSPHGKANAEFMAELFRSWGFETEIEVFHVLFPTPEVRSLEMTSPSSFKASLFEPGLDEDATSKVEGQLPPYNAYSPDGDVEAELVYVNQGLPKDYEELARRGISVKDKIVIVRYGGSWRGIKPKVAAEHGAVGCIIYSDPKDDGYGKGDVFPKGGYRNKDSVQRGSIYDMPLFAGDPLTPFVGATKDAKRIKRADSPVLVKIPTLPISYSDAQPLLAAMDGPVAPEEWTGGLPITYHLGPGAARVRLKLKFNWDLKPAYNVIAKLEGNERPDQWIVRGNHHDAWVFGAADPVSGMVAVLEEARAVGALAKTGWRPKRTLVYAGWDAEEPGLLGSVEWAETHADLLKEKAVVYVNSDSNSRGFFYAGGSHILEHMVSQAASEVRSPHHDMTVVERLRSALEVAGPEVIGKQITPRGDLRLSALGSGSDFTPFLQHLGVASLNLGFGGEGQYGQYHSTYDSFDHYSRFMDPDFSSAVTLAKVAGRIVLRLGNADVIPFEFQGFVDTVAIYVKELSELADGMRKATERNNRLIREGHYAAAANPNDHLQPPPIQEPVPHLNFAPLHNGLNRLLDSVKNFEAAAMTGNPSVKAQKDLDAILGKMEQALTRESGLPGRPWYRHFVYAPGYYTGYGVKTLPGVREAIELRKWEEAEAQILIAAEILERYAARLDQASKVYRN